MAKFSEDTLTNWTKPPSVNEEAKLQNSERLVKEAIKEDPKLKTMGTETFGQGSYANDTNVRLNSDIDINVRYTDAFYYQLPPGKTGSDYGFNSPTNYSVEEFKNDIEIALVNKFGRNCVRRENKCITVLQTSTRVETDVVPTWNFRRYDSGESYVLGAKFKSDSGASIVNFPKQHIDNAIVKNKATVKKFKRLTRIYRKLRYKMIEDKVKFSQNITSFLLECLVWNVPNEIFNLSGTWTELLKGSIVYLYKNTETDDTCKEWGEVSELLYLFSQGRKWTRQEVNEYFKILWNYLEY